MDISVDRGWPSYGDTRTALRPMVARESDRMRALSVEDGIDEGLEGATSNVREALEPLRRFVPLLAGEQDFLRDTGENQTAGSKHLADVFPREVRAL